MTQQYSQARERQGHPSTPQLSLLHLDTHSLTLACFVLRLRLHFHPPPNTRPKDPPSSRPALASPAVPTKSTNTAGRENHQGSKIRAGAAGSICSLSSIAVASAVGLDRRQGKAVVVVVAEVPVKFSSFVASPGSGQPSRLRLPTSPAPSLSTLHEQREGVRGNCSVTQGKEP
jgi:hypothetical protein